MAYKLNKVGVRRLSDDADISQNIGNTDWAEYQKWLAMGNTPQPADPDPIPQPPKDLLDWFNELSPARKGLFKAAISQP
jgi:hypothetical protein